MWLNQFNEPKFERKENVPRRAGGHIKKNTFFSLSAHSIYHLIKHFCFLFICSSPCEKCVLFSSVSIIMLKVTLKVFVALILFLKSGESSFFTSVKKLNDLITIDLKLFETITKLSENSTDQDLLR